MTGEVWPSACVAALFAPHPLHVESVVWIAERKDVLSTLFWFLALWAYARYTPVHEELAKVGEPILDLTYPSFPRRLIMSDQICSQLVIEDAINARKHWLTCRNSSLALLQDAPCL
jgi:hypothetical protein